MFLTDSSRRCDSVFVNFIFSSLPLRFDDFDEAIDEAIEEDLQDSQDTGWFYASVFCRHFHAEIDILLVSLAGVGCDKHVSTVTNQQRSTVSRETRRSVKPLAPRKRKRRRLNDLDSDSTVDEEESEDDFQLSDRCVCACVYFSIH